MAQLVIINLPNGYDNEIIKISAKSIIMQYLAQSQKDIDLLLSSFPATINNLNSQEDAFTLAHALNKLGIITKLIEENCNSESLLELGLSNEHESHDSLEELLSLLDDELPNVGSPTLGKSNKADVVTLSSRNKHEMNTCPELQLFDSTLQDLSKLGILIKLIGDRCNSESLLELGLSNEHESHDSLEELLSLLDDEPPSLDLPTLGKSNKADFVTVSPTNKPEMETCPELQLFDPTLQDLSKLGILIKLIGDRCNSESLLELSLSNEHELHDPLEGSQSLLDDEPPSLDSPTLSQSKKADVVTVSPTNKPEMDTCSELQLFDSTLQDLSKLLDGALGRTSETLALCTNSQNSSTSHNAHENGSFLDKMPQNILLSFDSDEEVTNNSQSTSTVCTSNKREISSEIDSQTTVCTPNKQEMPPEVESQTTVSIKPLTTSKLGAIRKQNIKAEAEQGLISTPHESDKLDNAITERPVVQANRINSPKTKHSEIAQEKIFKKKQDKPSLLMSRLFNPATMGVILLCVTGIATSVYLSIQPTIVDTNTRIVDTKIRNIIVNKLPKEQPHIIQQARVIHQKKTEKRSLEGTEDIEGVRVTSKFSIIDKKLKFFEIYISQKESPVLSTEDMIRGRRKRTPWLKSLEFKVEENQVEDLADLKLSDNKIEFSTPARAYLVDGEGRTRVVVNLNISIERSNTDLLLLRWAISGGAFGRIYTTNTAQRTSSTSFDLKYQGTIKIVTPDSPIPTGDENNITNSCSYGKPP